jgi:hypothetical protein
LQCLELVAVRRIVKAAENRKMADTVSAAWVQFAKTGNPNRDGLPAWPAYTAATDRLLEWGSTIASDRHRRAKRRSGQAAVWRRRQSGNRRRLIKSDGVSKRRFIGAYRFELAGFKPGSPLGLQRRS